MTARRRSTMSTRMRSAVAYRRLAAKAERAGQWRQVEHYTKLAERFTRQARADQEARARLKRAATFHNQAS